MVRQPEVKPGSCADPDSLRDFLDYLRGESYDITVHEYAVAQDLVLALAARGFDVSDSTVIKNHLGPVLCKSSRQQANFSAHFDHWAAGASSSAGSDDAGKQSAEQELALAARGWRTWRWLLVGVAALLVILLAWFWRFPRGAETSPATTIESPVPGVPPVVSPVPGVPPVNPHIPLAIIVYGAVGLALTLISWVLWWHFRGRLFLSRRTTSEEPDIVLVSVKAEFDEHFDRAILRKTSREFRRRYPVPSAELAIAATIEETVRSCTHFSPVFRSQLVAPEYLVLIDRKTFRDLSSRYVDGLLNCLAADQVQIERFYFDSDPRTVFPVKPGDSLLTLRDLAVKYPDHRLLLFTDGYGLFDSVSGDLAASAESLWSWLNIAFFTPKPRESWGYRERVLAGKALLYTATADSLLVFARHLNGVRSVEGKPPSTASAFPAELAERPGRWLERDPPEPKLVRQVLQSLRWYLGEDGYFWLGACAVYPEIQFQLTMYLGTNLKDAAGEMLCSAERLRALSRLPWMRHAFMPNWLRLELVTGLSREQNSGVRGVFDNLWLSAASDSKTPIRLEIAHRHRRALTALARSVFYRLRSKSARNGPLRDYVFASVMLGRSLEPLAVRVPRMWRELLKRQNESTKEEAALSPLQKWTTRIVMGGSIAVPLIILVALLDVIVLGGVAGAIKALIGISNDIVFLLAVSIVAPLAWLLVASGIGTVWLNRRLLSLGALLPIAIFLGSLIGIVMETIIFPTSVMRPRVIESSSDRSREAAQRQQLYQDPHQDPQRRAVYVCGSINSAWLLLSVGLSIFGSRKQIQRRKRPWQLAVVRRLVYAGALVHLFFPVIYLLFNKGLESVSQWWILGYFACSAILGGALQACGIMTGFRGLLGFGIATELLCVVLLVGSLMPEATYFPASLGWAGLLLVLAFFLRRSLGAGAPAEEPAADLFPRSVSPA